LKERKEVDTPGVSTVEKVAELLKVKPRDLVKTLIYQADDKPVAVLLRGDHELNEAKLKHLLKCDTLAMADEETIRKVTGGPIGFSGPVGLKGVSIVADYSVERMSGFVTGANKKDKHLINVNTKRDFDVKEWGDLRYITQEDTCPKCGKGFDMKEAIELGHIFKLGTKYSKSLGATVLDESGKEAEAVMGCYGIGVNRILAASIEQKNDKDGIIWPLSIAPYKAVIIEIDPEDDETKKVADKLYNGLEEASIDTIVDDRDVRPGVKFKDSDLIGIPIHIIIGRKNLKDGNIELKIRATKKSTIYPVDDIVPQIKKHL
jgi:prolyl-tRNA synthetase